MGLPAPHPSGWPELRKHRGPSLRPEPHKSLYRKGLPVKKVLVRGREQLLPSLGVLAKGKEGKWGDQIHNESQPGDIFSNKARWNHACICPLPTPHPDDSKRRGQQIRDVNKCDCPWLNNLERADTWRVWWGTGGTGMPTSSKLLILLRDTRKPSRGKKAMFGVELKTGGFTECLQMNY